MKISLLVLILAFTLVGCTNNPGSIKNDISIDNIRIDSTKNERVDTELSSTVKKSIELSLEEKYPEMDISSQDIKVDKMTEKFISGSVKDGGGGYFYGARDTSGAWILVADGNGTIYCEQIVGYNFPTDMISECYDMATNTTIQR